MRTPFVFTMAAALAAIACTVFAAQGTTSPYSDPAGDIDPGIASAGGTADLLGMEVTNDATNINFKLTVNGNVNPGTGGVDWAKFMIGIATGKTDGTQTGNGWGRPINLSTDNDPFAPQIVGMNYWIGSWVDGGSGGSQLWNYTGTAWSGPGALGSFSFTSGATSEISYSVPLASLNLAPGDTFYFDAYSSGGGGGDSAIDSLANPNVSITGWGGPYTSFLTSAGGPGLNSYTVAVPEPSTIVLASFGVVGVAVVRRLSQRKRSA